ncbi:hypothetical protein LCGC14_2406540, partial [marine sediment metagenome]
MSFRLADVKVGKKLTSGFIAVALIILAVGAIGVVNIDKISTAADQIMDVEVPMADASMEAMIGLITGRDLMGEYLLTTDIAELKAIEVAFDKSFVEAMGHLDYLIEKGTGQIKEYAEEADEYAEQFKAEAKGLMAAHNNKLELELEAEVFMQEFDAMAGSLSDKLGAYELQLTSGGNAIDEKIDASMESKYFMAVQKGIAEELMGAGDLSITERLRGEFKEYGEEFDALEGLLPAEIVSMHEEFESKSFAMFEKRDEGIKAGIAALEQMELVDEFSEKSDVSVDRVEEAAVENMESAMEVANKAEVSANFAMIGFSIAGFIIAFVLGVIFSRSITVPLAKGVEFAEAISKGELNATVDIDQKDEVGILVASLNDMAQNLRGIVTDIISSS